MEFVDWGSWNRILVKKTDFGALSWVIVRTLNSLLMAAVYYGARSGQRMDGDFRITVLQGFPAFWMKTVYARRGEVLRSWKKNLSD